MDLFTQLESLVILTLVPGGVQAIYIGSLDMHGVVFSSSVIQVNTIRTFQRIRDLQTQLLQLSSDDGDDLQISTGQLTNYQQLSQLEPPTESCEK